ncbi:MAG: hypothetical protein VKN56_10245 [Cyanobacteriota bacterium]|nr:hypothetical protein [Cyanobacteriota bacterium]
MRDLLSVRELKADALTLLFELADQLFALPRSECRQRLATKTLALMFFQPSTRTRLGFQRAGRACGCDLLDFGAPEMSRSVAYCGETLTDAANVVAQLADVLVIRHYDSQALVEAARGCGVPTINAGDGSNEHPTQAIADLWVLKRRLGALAGASLGLIGDPGTRVLRSIALAAPLVGIQRLRFLPSPDRQIPEDVSAALARANVVIEAGEHVEDLLACCEAVVLMPTEVADLTAEPLSLTGAQAPASPPDRYRLTRARLARYPDTWVLHPGPRHGELDPDTDDAPRNLMLAQVGEGMVMRMAILHWVLGWPC